MNSIAHKRVWWLDGLRLVTTLFLLCFTLFPVYWMITSAFKTTPEIMAIPPVFWPTTWTISNFIATFQTAGMIDSLRNSLVVGLTATALSILFGCSAGIGLSRFIFKGKDLIQSGIVLAQVMPTTILLVPLFIIWYQLHLYNTLISIIITYLVFGLPLATWLLTGYFSTIPLELEEQALIDGCSRLGATIRVILPLALPGLASTAIYVFLSAWNEYIIALILTASRSNFTFPVLIAGQFGQHSTDWGQIMALATAAMLPAFLLAWFVQRLFMSGLTQGSVKG